MKDLPRSNLCHRFTVTKVSLLFRKKRCALCSAQNSSPFFRLHQSAFSPSCLKLSAQNTFFKSVFKFQLEDFLSQTNKSSHIVDIAKSSRNAVTEPLSSHLLVRLTPCCLAQSLSLTIFPLHTIFLTKCVSLHSISD